MFRLASIASLEDALAHTLALKKLITRGKILPLLQFEASTNIKNSCNQVQIVKVLYVKSKTPVMMVAVLFDKSQLFATSNSGRIALTRLTCSRCGRIAVV